MDKSRPTVTLPKSSTEPTAITLEEESVILDDPLSGLGPEVPSEESAAISSILDSEIDPEELARKKAELYLQTGTYIWLDNKCNVRITFDSKDKRSTDIAQRKGHNLGRCLINVSGVVIESTSGRRGRFAFGASPDVRTRGEEIDFYTKNYAMLTEYFFKKYERDPQTEGEIVHMITACGYSMYITRGRNGGNYLGRLQNLVNT